MFETAESLKKVRKKALMLVKEYIIVDASNSITNTNNIINKKLNILDKK